MSFGDDIRRIAAARGVETEQVVRGVSLQAIESVVSKTPVDEGFARGSWVATLNAPSSTVQVSEDDSGQATINAANAVANQLVMGDVFYLVSNMPYMTKLELGGYSQGPYSTSKTNSSGYSIQAPNGMVRLTVREILAGLRQA